MGHREGWNVSTLPNLASNICKMRLPIISTPWFHVRIMKSGSHEVLRGHSEDQEPSDQQLESLDWEKGSRKGFNNSVVLSLVLEESVF